LIRNRNNTTEKCYVVKGRKYVMCREKKVGKCGRDEYIREILIERQLANMIAVARGSAFVRHRYMRYTPRLPQLRD